MKYLTHIPADTLRNNDVVIMPKNTSFVSKWRRFDVITSKSHRFDVITTLLLRHVFSVMVWGEYMHQRTVSSSGVVNGVSSIRCQAITSANSDSLSIWRLITDYTRPSILIRHVLFTKMSSVLWRPCCSGLDMLYDVLVVTSGHLSAYIRKLKIAAEGEHLAFKLSQKLPRSKLLSKIL